MPCHATHHHDTRTTIPCHCRGVARSSCSTSSHTCRGNRRGERFECVRCGNLDNADSNAAAIILRRGTGIMVSAGAGMVLERRELGRTRKPPHTVYSSGRKRRENQACNRPATSSVTKHRRHTCYTRATLVYNSRGPTRKKYKFPQIP